MAFLVSIDFTIVYDFMILVLSCHAYVFLSIIRIALPLLLSSIAMLSCHRFFQNVDYASSYWPSKEMATITTYIYVT